MSEPVYEAAAQALQPRLLGAVKAVKQQLAMLQERPSAHAVDAAVSTALLAQAVLFNALLWGPDQTRDAAAELLAALPAEQPTGRAPA